MFAKNRAALLALIVLVGSCGGAPMMTLDKALEQHTAARGGKDAIERVNALEADLEISEPSFTVTGVYRATRDGFMRIDVYAGDERVFTEALGPDGAWQMGQAETIGSPVSTDGEIALRNGVFGNLFGLHELPAHGFALSLIGEEERGGGAHWVIERKSPDGDSKTLYLDKDTYLVTREIETGALHPDVDATKARFETLRLDYEESAGVLFSRRSEKRNLDTGELAQTDRIVAMRINPDIDPSVFKSPQ